MWSTGRWPWFLIGPDIEGACGEMEPTLYLGARKATGRSISLETLAIPFAFPGLDISLYSEAVAPRSAAAAPTRRPHQKQCIPPCRQDCLPMPVGIKAPVKWR